MNIVKSLELKKLPNSSIDNDRRFFLTPLRQYLNTIEQIDAPLLRLKEEDSLKLCLSQKPVAVMNVWETLIEAQRNIEFKKFMITMGVPESDFRGEITGWNIYKHKRDGVSQSDLNGKPTETYERQVFVPSTMMTVNDRLIESLGKKNPYYSFKISKSTIARTMRNIESLDTEFVYSIVFTFPQEVSRLYLESPRPFEIDLRIKKCIKTMTRIMEKLFGGRIAMSVNRHMWSSINPLNPHAHAHCLLLDRVISKDKENRLIPSHFMTFDKRTKKYTESLLTKLLKRNWASIINTEFELDYYTIDIKVDFVELKKKDGMENKVGHKRLIHKLKYNRRRPISDLALFYLFNEFDCKKVDNEYADHLINYDNRTLCFGYWNKMSKFKKKTLDEELDKDDRQTRCQLCGEALVYVGFQEGKELPDSVIKIFLDRRGMTWMVGERG